MGVRTTSPASPRLAGPAIPARADHDDCLATVYVYGLLLAWLLLAITDPFGARGEELSWLGAAFVYVFVALVGWTGVVAAVAGMTRAFRIVAEEHPAALQAA